MGMIITTDHQTGSKVMSKQAKIILAFLVFMAIVGFIKDIS